MRMSTEILLLHNINISESPCQPFALDSLSTLFRYVPFVHDQVSPLFISNYVNNCPSGHPSHQPAGSAESLVAIHTKLMLHIDLVILTDWLLDGPSVAGAGGGACGEI